MDDKSGYPYDLGNLHFNIKQDLWPDLILEARWEDTQLSQAHVSAREAWTMKSSTENWVIIAENMLFNVV